MVCFFTMEKNIRQLYITLNIFTHIHILIKGLHTPVPVMCATKYPYSWNVHTIQSCFFDLNTIYNYSYDLQDIHLYSGDIHTT